MSSIVTVNRLSKFYGVVVGLNDVTFDINEGVTGLLGPNGAGKSTFMKLLTGQLKPTRGSIQFKGEDIWKNANVFNSMGFCPEQDVLYGHLTGLQFVTYMLCLQGFDSFSAKKKAKDVLDYMGMSECMNRKSLSLIHI